MRIAFNTSRGKRFRFRAFWQFPLSVFVLLTVVWASCSNEKNKSNDLVSIGTSLRVFGLILDELVGEALQVHVLISDAQSPHSFHPRPSEIAQLSEAKTLILGAPELDGWAEELAGTDVLYLADLIAEETWIYERDTRNPHFWMDPMVVHDFLPALAERICDLDEKNCDLVERNARRFAVQLEQLDDRIASEMAALSGKQFVTSQGFFDYFLKRYGIVSAGSLVSVPGHEPTPARIVEMLNRAEREGFTGIIAQSRLPDTAARLFRDESRIPLAYVDPVGNNTDSSYATFLLAITGSLTKTFSERP